MYQAILWFELVLCLEEAESPAPQSWKDSSLLSSSSSFSIKNQNKTKTLNTTMSVYSVLKRNSLLVPPLQLVSTPSCNTGLMEND